MILLMHSWALADSSTIISFSYIHFLFEVLKWGVKVVSIPAVSHIGRWVTQVKYINCNMGFGPGAHAYMYISGKSLVPMLQLLIIGWATVAL